MSIGVRHRRLSRAEGPLLVGDVCGSSTPPCGASRPRLARLAEEDGAHVLVEVLGRPDLLGRVEISYRGDRCVVPARWLDPKDELAADLLTSGDRVVRADRPAAPRPHDKASASLSSARPISKTQTRKLLRLRHMPHGPDCYLLSLDGKRIWALRSGRVLSGHDVGDAPRPKPKAPRIRAEVNDRPCPYFGVPIGTVGVSESLKKLFGGNLAVTRGYLLRARLIEDAFDPPALAVAEILVCNQPVRVKYVSIQYGQNAPQAWIRLAEELLLERDGARWLTWEEHFGVVNLTP